MVIRKPFRKVGMGKPRSHVVAVRLGKYNQMFVFPSKERAHSYIHAVHDKYPQAEFLYGTGGQLAGGMGKTVRVKKRVRMGYRLGKKGVEETEFD
jgi:hypothetical protein